MNTIPVDLPNETINRLIEFATKIEEFTHPLEQYKRDKIAKIKQILGVKIESNNLTIICSPLCKEQFKSYFSDVVKVHEDKNLKGYAFIVFDNSISELKLKQEIQVSDENENRYFMIDLEKCYLNSGRKRVF